MKKHVCILLIIKYSFLVNCFDEVDHRRLFLNINPAWKHSPIFVQNRASQVHFKVNLPYITRLD